MLGDRLCARKRIGVLLLAVPSLLAGSAYLASNDVPVTYAGVVHFDVSIPTRLTVTNDEGNNATVNLAQSAHVQDSYHFAHVAAHLTTADGSDLGGETVTFTTDTSRSGAGVICQATSDDKGIAKCPNNTKIATTEFSGVPTTFVATFAGDGSLQSSTASGELSPLAADAGPDH